MTSQNMDSNDHRYNAAGAARVFLDHGDFIREVICSHIQDHDQADDLFQEFFLSLVSDPPPRDIQNIESYLYKAIMNDIIDAAHRKKKYGDLIHKYAERSNHPCSQTAPEEVILKMEETGKVLDLIEKRLPRAEAQAVCLQYRDNHNAEEIAEKMGVRAATVRGYVSEGLSRIRRLFSAKEG
jgi:RNA polymerase sigma factor (sigma-70 family)